METADIGLIGLAVMGENLALNFEGKGYAVAVYNRRSPGREHAVDRFVEGRGRGKRLVGTHSIRELVESVRRPRRILMMIRAGEPVDEVIGQLMPYLERGDVVIDGGNSDYLDTQRRVAQAEKAGLSFVECGVSGGELGALHGPSLMPGGSAAAWPLIKEPFQAIAAKLDDGSPCCEWIGPGGSGHFVKTVHNGIEYGDMQLIAETYSLLRNRLGMDNESLASLFESWNRGELNSYLIGITAEIFRFKDDDGAYLLDRIRDVARQKGTGKWSVSAALDRNDPLTLIAEAVFARMLSALPDERRTAAEGYPDPQAQSVVETLTAGQIRAALYASKLVSYAQGFSLMRRVSELYDWRLDYGTIARIWRNGCIIRSAFLEKVTEAFRTDPDLRSLLFDDFFRDKIGQTLPAWRRVVAHGALGAVALPCMSSALNYFDGLRTLRSPANLLQAQRDYFGAHRYERIDRDDGTTFHIDWTGRGGNTSAESYEA